MLSTNRDSFSSLLSCPNDNGLFNDDGGDDGVGKTSR